MNKMMLTVALAGLMVAAPSVMFADNSQQQSPNFTRGACQGSTTDCLKQAGSDTVQGLKNVGTNTVDVAKSATNTVVGAAKDTGKAVAKPFSGNSSSQPQQQAQTQQGQ